MSSHFKPFTSCLFVFPALICNHLPPPVVFSRPPLSHCEFVFVLMCRAFRRFSLSITCRPTDGRPRSRNLFLTSVLSCESSSSCRYRKSCANSDTGIALHRKCINGINSTCLHLYDPFRHKWFSQQVRIWWEYVVAQSGNSQFVRLLQATTVLSVPRQEAGVSSSTAASELPQRAVRGFQTNRSSIFSSPSCVRLDASCLPSA